MSSRIPPTLVTALLKRLSINDPLAGDLREAYLAGKSAWWVWRQVVGAIVASIAGEVRAHRFSLVTCLTAGWLVSYQVAPVIVRFTIAQAIQSHDRLYFANGGMPPPHSGDFIWIINVAILIFTNAAGGFAAVRWHTGQWRLLALMFAATVVVQRMLILVFHSTVYDPSTVQLYFMFRPAGATAVTLIALESLAALAGSAAGARREHA